jgi:hypothetical protein
LHDDAASRDPGAACMACQGLPLLPAIVSHAPPGMVLAIPESALIDTGAITIVFVERGPGMFDGIEIETGPPCDGFYPVLRGLRDGERVASAGAILLDAETKLNPSLAAGYFGAGGRSAARAGDESRVRRDESRVRRGGGPAAAEQAEIRRALLELPEGDRAAALAQRICPVTDALLGSMGKPIAIEVRGRRVFICCAGCETALLDEPDKHLPKIP